MSTTMTRILKRGDFVSVSAQGKFYGTGEIVRVHQNNTVSVLWSNSASTVDGAIQKIANPAQDGARYVSRVDASYCDLITF